MNIEEYRAMVAQEKAQAEQAQQTGVNVDAQTQQVSNESVLQSNTQTQQTEPVQQAENTQATTQAEPSKSEQPQTFVVDGQEVTLEELQRGYLRQSDYTRKTQEVSRQAREVEQARQLLEAVQQNPEIASQLGFDPQQQHIETLQQNYYDLLVQQEVSELSTKYADFEASEVLNFALENRMENLEHAYLLNKQYKANAPTQVNTRPQYTQPANQNVDVEALKAQIRAELQAELNTSTIISSGGSAPKPQAEAKLSPEQIRIAKMMKMSPDEYAKWSQFK